VILERLLGGEGTGSRGAAVAEIAAMVATDRTCTCGAIWLEPWGKTRFLGMATIPRVGAGNACGAATAPRRRVLPACGAALTHRK